MPFFIQSKLGDLVIDIERASKKPGTPLDLYTKKTKSPDWDNQLWEFVNSTFKGSYLLQNPASKLVIDVRRAGAKPGTPLDAYTIHMIGQPPVQTNAPNQLWSFVPSPTVGYYFIVSHLGNGDLVIDIERASTKPDTPLDVWTKKTKSPEWDNQLWTFVDEKGMRVTPPPPFVPPPPPK